jgi:hypothetical protein
MQKITSAAELTNAIQILEAEQAEHGRQLKEQFRLTFESIKPLNLLKSTINDITSSPWLIENIIGAALGLASGYFSKKIIIGASANRFRKLLGSVLQFGVTNLISQHPDALKSFGLSIFQHFSHAKKSKISEEESVFEI